MTPKLDECARQLLEHIDERRVLRIRLAQLDMLIMALRGGREMTGCPYCAGRGACAVCGNDDRGTT